MARRNPVAGLALGDYLDRSPLQEAAAPELDDAAWRAVLVGVDAAERAKLSQPGVSGAAAGVLVTRLGQIGRRQAVDAECRGTRAALARYVVGRSRLSEREAVEHHRRRCIGCDGLFRQMRELPQRLPAAPAGLVHGPAERPERMPPALLIMALSVADRFGLVVGAARRGRPGAIAALAGAALGIGAGIPLAATAVGEPNPAPVVEQPSARPTTPETSRSSVAPQGSVEPSATAAPDADAGVDAGSSPVPATGAQLPGAGGTSVDGSARWFNRDQDAGAGVRPGPGAGTGRDETPVTSGAGESGETPTTGGRPTGPSTPGVTVPGSPTPGETDPSVTPPASTAPSEPSTSPSADPSEPPSGGETEVTPSPGATEGGGTSPEETATPEPTSEPAPETSASTSTPTGTPAGSE